MFKRLIGIGAAMLPRRWWPWMDEYVPASSSALLAGIVTLLAAGAIGIPGFLDYVGYTSAANAAAAIRVVEENLQTRPDLDNAASLRHMAVSLSAFSIFTFLLGTPLGLATTYLALTGLVRAGGALFDDPRGDPALSLLDGIVCRTRHARRERRARTQRTALEGIEIPDRVMSPAQAGIPNCDVVLVCSRRKPGWDTGTVLITEHAPYRVGAIEERTIGGWLRTLYALSEHTDQEAFRRTVRYNLPK